MSVCPTCYKPMTKRRPNSCQKCYYKQYHLDRYQNKARKCISCGKEGKIKHNVYCDECKSDIKSCGPDHRIYFGRKFYKNQFGYWVCCKSGMPWAHRWVWMNLKGEIPKGFEIHHIDGDKDNNNISNLEILSASEHQKKHWDQGDHNHEMEIRIKTLWKHHPQRKNCEINTLMIT